jgi:hypothetical protein
VCSFFFPVTSLLINDLNVFRLRIAQDLKAFPQGHFSPFKVGNKNIQTVTIFYCQSLYLEVEVE